MFPSFVHAGFECTTAINAGRVRIDSVADTQHDVFLEEDYRLLSSIGIRTVREGIRWPLVDDGSRYDFSSLQPVLDAARRHGLHVIYDLCHFGYPDCLDPFSPEFSSRFADYCYAAARFIATFGEQNVSFVPMNEPSYFAWAGGEVGLFAPHCVGRGWDLKVSLVSAAIAGTNAIRAAIPGARIISIDPVCRVIPPAGVPELADEARQFNEVTAFQSWDMLAGRLLPELGGSPEHLGIVGINYYWTNQWQADRPEQPLADDDARRVPLSTLVRAVWERYGADVLITETSHAGAMRASWIRELDLDVATLLDAGVPLRGVCLYPILSMPDWHNPEQWIPLGLWDLELRGSRLERIPVLSALQALNQAQRLSRGA